MNLIFVQAGRRFFRQAIVRADDFGNPFDGRPYPCLVWTHGAPLPPDERWELAQRLVTSQCRYAVCGGTECEAIHDDVDSAYIGPFLEDGAEDLQRPHVMTTWHAGEPHDEVAFFFVLNTNFDEHDFREYLVVHVGGLPRDHEALEAAVRRAAMGEAAV
jgi:hypothetical protein